MEENIKHMNSMSRMVVLLNLSMLKSKKRNYTMVATTEVGIT